MNRLTFEGNFCDIAMCGEVRGGSFCKDGNCSQRKVWERLKWYEDLEERGRLVVLPCKVGDTVYDVGEFINGIPYPEMYELRADFIGVGISKEGRTTFDIDCNDFLYEDFGKTVFLTREEAEAALEKEAL